jgi:alanyl-tRNA synthetase
MGNQISKATVNEAMEGYFATLELEHIKSEYDVITKELSRLNSLDKLLESTDRKRKNVPMLKEMQETLKQKYNDLYPVVEEWLKASFPQKKKEKKATKEEQKKKEQQATKEEQEKKEKVKRLEILLNYYADIKTRNLQDTINRLYPPTIIFNKKEGKLVPLYLASNLRQEMHTAWKGQIEGR